MSEPTEHSDTPHPDDLAERQTPWAVSLCFWFTLLLAATVYGAVALAPKLAVWHRVKSDYDSNIQQLVTLEEDVEYLERVDHALKTDPEFVQRLLGATRPVPSGAEELIPVSGSLLFGQGEESEEQPADVAGESIFARVIGQLASNTRLRTVLLAFSAGLTIFGFTFLNDAGAGFVQATGSLIYRVALMPTTRYFGAPQLDEPELDSTPQK